MAVTEGPIANIKGSTQAAGETTPQHVLVVDATGSAVTFGGSGGTSSVDRAAFTAGTTLGTPAMGVYEATPTTLTDGQQGFVGLTTNREVKVSVTSGGTAGTQYTEGDIDASITGTAMMTEGPSNTATPVQSNAAKDVLVAVNAALPAGTNAIGKLAANSGVTIGAVEIAASQTVSLPQSSTASAAAQTAQGTTAASVLAANASRKLVSIQNTGTTIIKLNLGASNPTATVYHYALGACAAADDGTGGAWISSVWTGEVRAISSGASGTCVITELT